MGKSSTTIGFRYYLGVEAACCIGPVDEFSQLLVGDRVAWKGSVTAQGSIDIDQPNLFGGDTREGGVSGVVEVRMGGPTQLPDAYMSAYLGVRIPANRGIFSLIFRGRTFAEYHAQGYTVSNNPIMLTVVGAPIGPRLIYKAYMGPSSFYWASGNPYIKTITPTVTRILAGWTTAVWYPEKAQITQVQDYATAPNTAATGQTFLRSGCGTGDLTLLYPTNYTDITADFVGYALIDSEWVRVTAVNTDTQSMTVQRHWFGTTAATHAAVAVVYLYQIASGPLKAMNPAHMLYQVFTDTVQGMGKPTALIDDGVWRATADALYAEGFGLCVMWSEQSSIEDFALEILKHIDGVLDLNLRTGLYELRLVRNDYNPATLPVFDESTIISFDAFERPGWGETTNELIVKFVNQATGAATTTTPVQDLANIYIQGQVVSQTKDYLGIQNPVLAYRVADRDLRALSTPLAHLSFKNDRTAWPVKKGDPIKVSWAARGVTQLICRVIDIDYGSLEDGAISITALEDIFALPAFTYATPQPPLWQNPAAAPRTILNVRTTEVPYYLLAAAIDTTHLAGVESYPLILAQTPAIQNQQMVVYQSATVGFDGPVKLGTAGYAASLVLGSDIARDTEVLPFSAFTGGLPDAYSGGGLALIDEEWLGIVLVDMTANTVTVVRSVLDSIPATHVLGATIWLVAQGTNAQGFLGTSGLAVSLRGATEYYRETGKSPSGESALSSAPTQTHIHVASWFNPYPPSRVELDAQDTPARIRGDFTVTWGGRNRLQQTVGLIGWFDTSIFPESGVTYTLEVYDPASDALIGRFDGLTVIKTPGGSFQFHGDAGTATSYTVNLYAVRGTARSQVYTYTCPIYGYGLDYGNEYGGAELGIVLPRASRSLPYGSVTAIPNPLWLNGRWYSFTVEATLVSLDGVTWAGEGPATPEFGQFPGGAYLPGTISNSQVTYGGGHFVCLVAGWIYHRKENGKWTGNSAFGYGGAPGILTDMYSTGGMWTGVTWDGSQFILVWNNTDIWTSPTGDGATWTHVGASGVISPVILAAGGGGSVGMLHNLIRKVGGVYVTAGTRSATPRNYFYATSTDLTTWTIVEQTANDWWWGAVGARYWQGYYYYPYDGVVRRSTDLITWAVVFDYSGLTDSGSGQVSLTQHCLDLVINRKLPDSSGGYYFARYRTTNGTTWAEVLPAWNVDLVGECADRFSLEEGPPHLFLQVASPVEFGGKLLSLDDAADPSPTLAWPSTAPNGKYCGSTQVVYEGAYGNSAWDDSGLTMRFTRWGISCPRVLRTGKYYLEATLLGFEEGYPAAGSPTFLMNGLVGRAELDFLPAQGDVIGLAFDLLSGVFKCYVNNSLIKTGAITLPITLTGYAFAVDPSFDHAQFSINVGQTGFVYPQAGYTAWMD